MNKKAYSKPVAEFVQFNNEDIVVTSGCGHNSYWGCLINSGGEKGCIVLHSSDHCRSSQENVSGCWVTQIWDTCKKSSFNGKPIDCQNNWTNWYSET